MKVLIKGAGDLATGIAYELWLAGHDILMTDIEVPLAVRRAVSFSRAVYEDEATVEDVTGVLVHNLEEAKQQWKMNHIAVMVDEKAEIRTEMQPDVVVDGIMAKENLGTRITDAPIVVAIGPGFCAGVDCHYVIETQRGRDLGCVIDDGCATPNTGIPGEVGGYTIERLLKASADGIIEPIAKIGDIVEKGQIVAITGGVPVYAAMKGIVRGMLQSGVKVTKGLKIGDVDARLNLDYCYTISDKARKIGVGVLMAMERGGIAYEHDFFGRKQLESEIKSEYRKQKLKHTVVSA